MDELLGYLLLFFAAITAVFFVVWTIVATILRIVAWMVFYWAVTASLGLVAGMIAGLVVPLRVLTGRSSTQPDIATPAKVHEGTVITFKPRGFARHYGWDRAWPVYNPYQARRDAWAVRADVQESLARLWEKISSGVRKPELDASGSGTAKLGSISSSLVKSTPGVLWAIFVPIPYAGLWIGVWASVGVWFLVMLVLGGVVHFGQSAITLGHRGLDRSWLRRSRASVKCPSCYETSPYPSYRCSNPSCTIVHRGLFPGPLGVSSRRCECGTSLPTTVRAAARQLVAMCPYCNAELASGSGSRQTIQLPTFGAVAAGKTRLFAAALASAEPVLAGGGGRLEALTPEADGFLRAATQAVRDMTPTIKTQFEQRPTGKPLQFTDGSGHTVELQVMDAAGESFTDWHATEELTYVNSARAMVLVLDPLAFPRVHAQLSSVKDLADAVVAAGSQEDAYASVADRLRSEDIDLSKRHLAVVITKVDLLRRLPAGASLDPSSSDSVRAWLCDQEQDGFLRRIESDFGDVTYFAFDSLHRHDADDVHNPLNPLRLLQWALASHRAPLALIPQPKPVAATAGSLETETVNVR